MKTEEDLNFIADHLAEFFAKDPRKIALWLLTKNNHFGGISPADLISLRGSTGLRKVAQFVRDAKEGNMP